MPTGCSAEEDRAEKAAVEKFAAEWTVVGVIAAGKAIGGAVVYTIGCGPGRGVYCK